MAIVSGNPMDRARLLLATRYGASNRMDRGTFRLRDVGRLCRLTISRWSESRRSLANHGHGGLPLQRPHPRGRRKRRIRSPGPTQCSTWLTPERDAGRLALTPLSRCRHVKDRVRTSFCDTDMNHTLSGVISFGDSEVCLVELRRVLVRLQPDIEIAA